MSVWGTMCRAVGARAGGPQRYVEGPEAQSSDGPSEEPSAVDASVEAAGDSHDASLEATGGAVVMGESDDDTCRSTLQGMDAVGEACVNIRKYSDLVPEAAGDSSAPSER